MSKQAAKPGAKPAQPDDQLADLVASVPTIDDLSQQATDIQGNLTDMGSNFLSQGQQNITNMGSNLLSQGQQRLQSSLPDAEDFIPAGAKSAMQNANKQVTGIQGKISDAAGLGAVAQQQKNALQGEISAAGGDLLAQGQEGLKSGIAGAIPGSAGFLAGGTAHVPNAEGVEGDVAASIPDVGAMGSNFLSQGEEAVGAMGDNLLAQGQDAAGAIGDNLLAQGQANLTNKITGRIPGANILSKQTPGVQAAKGLIGATGIPVDANSARNLVTGSLPGFGDLAQTREDLEGGITGALPDVGAIGSGLLSNATGNLESRIPGSDNIPHNRDIKPGAAGEIVASPLSLGDADEKLKDGVDGYEKKLAADLEGFKSVIEGYIDSYLERVRDRIYRVPKSDPPTEAEIDRWEARTRLINIGVNVFAAALFVLFLVLILILFFAPQAYHNASLVGPQKAAPPPKEKSAGDVIASQLSLPTPSFLHGIAPQVLVTLLATALISMASILISRFVEHDLWLRKGCTPTEVQLKAKWPGSPGVRISYLAMGSSNTLKLAGLLMIPFIIVPTVLIAGISLKSDTAVTVTEVANTTSTYGGFLGGGQSLFFAGNPGAETAAIASLQGLTLPPNADTPCGSDDNCNVSADVGAVKATCSTGTQKNALSQTKTVFTLSSKLDDSIAVRLTSAGGQYASFMSSTYPSRSWLLEQLKILAEQSPSAASQAGNISAPASVSVPTSVPTGITKRQGDLSSINSTINTFSNTTDLTKSIGGLFGVILGAYRDVDSSDVHTVECNLTFGSATITQAGKSPSGIKNDSYTQAKTNFYDSEFRLPALTFASDASSIFTFVAARTPLDQSQGRIRGSVTGSPTIGWFLLWSNGSVNTPITPPEAIASNIVTAFEYYTLLSFIKNPDSANITATKTVYTEKYVYNGLFLLILIAPLAAVLLAGFGRLKVGGNHSVPGYDPITIAQRGIGGFGGNDQGNGNAGLPVQGGSGEKGGMSMTSAFFT